MVNKSEAPKAVDCVVVVDVVVVAIVFVVVDILVVNVVALALLIVIGHIMSNKVKQVMHAIMPDMHPKPELLCLQKYPFGGLCSLKSIGHW